MNPQNAKRRSTAIGLVILCLIPLLTSCASPPTLQTVYVATPPSRETMSLLCQPKAPTPPDKMDNGQLRLYLLDLLDGVKECRAQQDEFQAEIERQRKRTRRFQ